MALTAEREAVYLEIAADLERHLERAHAQLWEFYGALGYKPGLAGLVLLEEVSEDA